MLGDEDVLLQIGRELPLVGGVCLGDVDEGERRAVAESFVQALDVARPATERRSGEASEHQHEGSRIDERPEQHALTVVQTKAGEVRQLVADLE